MCFHPLSSLFGADPTGTIAGTVLDPSGAAVPGASVTATALSTGLKRVATTSVDGGYLFPLLPVGPYSVTVEAAGFRRFEQKGIIVQTDQSATVPIKLEIGSTIGDRLGGSKRRAGGDPHRHIEQGRDPAEHRRTAAEWPERRFAGAAGAGDVGPHRGKCARQRRHAADRDLSRRAVDQFQRRAGRHDQL